jgi:hypothetical protein
MATSKKPPPKQKHWFQITVEGTAPIRVQFRAFDYDEESAYETYLKNPSMAPIDGRPQIELRQIIKKRITIKNLITGMIKWVKTF